VKSWHRRGWHTAGGKPIAHVELWKEIMLIWAKMEKVIVVVKKVKAHSGH